MTGAGLISVETCEVYGEGIIYNRLGPGTVKAGVEVCIPFQVFGVTIRPQTKTCAETLVAKNEANHLFRQNRPAEPWFAVFAISKGEDQV